METPSHPPQIIEWSVASRPLPGQSVSGDLHLVKAYPEGYLVAVVDGLGHGDEATAAAKIAIETLSSSSAKSPMTFLVHRCNDALIKTRGVVMTVAFLQVADATVTWLGVGNVDGLLVRADSKASHQTENVLLRGGVLGYQMPTLQASVIPVSRGDLLIFTTDGIRPGYHQVIVRNDSPKQLADRILAQYFKGTDDALVLVVRYLGPQP